MEMTLVEMLRDEADWLTPCYVVEPALLREAADRIEELEKTIHDACQGLTHCMSRFGVCVCGTYEAHKAPEEHQTPRSVWSKMYEKLGR